MFRNDEAVTLFSSVRARDFTRGILVPIGAWYLIIGSALFLSILG